MPKKKHRKHTPITSEKQRGAFGIAYAAAKGEVPVSKLGGTAKQIYESVTTADLRSHLKETAGKKLPKKSRKKANPNERYDAAMP